MIATILAFIPKPVFAGIVVVLLLSSVLQTCRVSKLIAENARYEIAVEQCKVTNDNNKQAIETIKLINSQCLDERRTDETRHANAVAAWNAEKALLTEKAKESEIRNVEVYREPSCKELALIDINAVCPTFVERMRQRAESYNRVRNKGN